MNGPRLESMYSLHLINSSTLTRTSIRKRPSVCKENGFDILLKAVSKVLTNDFRILVQIAGDGPFGNALLETTTIGIPIVTTRNDGALHLLNGETAILINQVQTGYRVEF